MNIRFFFGVLAMAFSMAACNNDCTESTWYEDADQDGLGNPDVSQSACDQPSGYVTDNNDPDDNNAGELTLHAAWEEFDQDNFTIFLDGAEVVIESNGLPNHTSPYWSTDHPLFVEPTVTSFDIMAPGNIDEFNGSYSTRLPASPSKSTSTSSTGLGAIGMAVSGSMIYNDEEGPNVPLDNAVKSLDFSGAHTGPQSYHYHLEPLAWSQDDDKLIGFISDGFFLYGRKCSSTDDYPTDLDASGGHTAITQHSAGVDEYHYHIQNELYLNEYYILFPGDYQGEPNAIQ